MGWITLTPLDKQPDPPNLTGFPSLPGEVAGFFAPSAGGAIVPGGLNVAFPEIVPREAGNFILPAYPGLIVKDTYWRWPERNLAGDAIDFFMRVPGLSFHDAMRQITAP